MEFSEPYRTIIVEPARDPAAPEKEPDPAPSREPAPEREPEREAEPAEKGGAR